MTLIKDVKYGSRRSELIFFLLDLMDKKYQEKWLKANGGYGFQTEIGFAYEMFFDELDLAKNVKSNTTPDDGIGDFFKTTKETYAILQVSKHLRPLWRESDDDKDFLSSPHLLPMRGAAKECFIEFINNEKDNEKFCNFVLKVISRDHFFIPNSEKTSYGNIVDYIQSVNIE